ncbi:hypothetical protein [Streptomyces sp. IBSBF 3136]|uniref:hypothetical protein n=1 Tax=Streptomyces sp. IBSBF 3136 TaxID=2903524 RepID=UPI002FDC2069
MSDQPYQGGPYEGYDGHQGHQPYDPYRDHQAQQHQQHQRGSEAQPHRQQAAQPWPGEAQAGYDQYGYDQYGQPQPYAEPYPQAGYDPQQTQQWQGRTWETQAQAQVRAAETAYLPPQEPYTPPAAAPEPQPHHAPEAGPEAQPHHAPEAGPEAEAGPGYGPATLAGNSRITDAQRARLEGRSPIIDPGMQPALLTAGLGLLLAVTAPLGSYALVVPLVLLQAVTAAGWFRLNGMWPARQGIALAFLGALTADVAVLAAGRGHAPVAILGPLGIWVLLSLVLQLRSHASPDERMYGLMATVASSSLAVLATGYLAAAPHAVSVGAAAVAVAVLARALPLPTPASLVVSVVAAAGAGIAVGGMTGFGTKGAALGAAAAICALVGHRVAAYDYPSRFVHFTAGVALPLSAAAPVVWVLGRALG